MTAIATDPTHVPSPTATASRGALRALTGTGLVLLTLGATLGPVMMFSSADYSELAGTTAHLVHYAVWTGALVALSQIYPRLAGLDAGAGRRISAAAATAAAVGAGLDACARFSLAFFNPFLAEEEPRLLDMTPSAVVLVPSIGVGVVAMVGTIWLGVSGWRARVFPRAAVVVLVVGALSIPALGPVSNVLVGAALAWIGIAVLRRR